MQKQPANVLITANLFYPWTWKSVSGKVSKDISSGTRLKRLFAVAASDSSVDKPKGCISKLERLKLVEDFVNRYLWVFSLLFEFD